MAYYEACLTTIPMNEPFSIVPPPELVEKWSDIKPMEDAVVQNWVKIATQAARWGADQRGAVNEAELQKARDEELKACLWHLESNRCNQIVITTLRAARRPKPPSLKEQALEALQFVDEKLDLPLHNHCNAIHTIRRALEQL
jgi:hypothetical protein